MALTRTFLVGTRGSDLARAMTETVLGLLRAGDPASTFRVRVITSAGDADRRSALRVLGAGGRGVFASALEDALSTGAVDIAVHSLKDLPTRMSEDLCLGAVPLRDDPRDVVCGGTLAELPLGARVGTGSPRRRAQLLHARRDLNVVALRGNVVPRLHRLERSRTLAAVVLAGAGVRRVGREDAIGDYLPLESHTPAAGQGAIALQARRADDEVRELLSHVDDHRLHAAIGAERLVLGDLEGGCSAPIGVYANVLGATMTLRAQVTALDGSRDIVAERSGPASDTSALVREVTQAMRAAGAAELVGAGR